MHINFLVHEITFPVKDYALINDPDIDPELVKAIQLIAPKLEGYAIPVNEITSSIVI